MHDDDEDDDDDDVAFNAAPGRSGNVGMRGSRWVAVRKLLPYIVGPLRMNGWSFVR